MSTRFVFRAIICASMLAACTTSDRLAPASPPEAQAAEALLARLDQVVAQALFDPRLLDTPEWRRFRADFGASARAAQSPVVTLEHREGGVALMRISSFFGDQIAGQMDTALSEAIRSGASTLVIDLRGNPGGTFAAWPVMDRLLAAPATVAALVTGRWYASRGTPPTTPTSPPPSP